MSASTVSISSSKNPNCLIRDLETSKFDKAVWLMKYPALVSRSLKNLEDPSCPVAKVILSIEPLGSNADDGKEEDSTQLLKRSPSSFTPCLDGRYLLLRPNKELNHYEILKFLKQDADAYPRYEHQLEKFCKIMDPLLDSPTPESLQGNSSVKDRFQDKLSKSAFWARLQQQAMSSGKKYMVDASLCQGNSGYSSLV